MARIRSCIAFARAVLWRLLTFAYYESFQRNTVDPLNRIIQAPNDDVRLQLLREWSDIKVEESKYIQIAGGFLFTTVASCLTWNSTETSHWTGPALFYASTVFALVAIISGSQQLWILPRVDASPSNSDAGKKRREELVSFIARLSNDEGGPKSKYVFALQTPIMLLTFSVMAFLAGLCAVVYSPLAARLAWDDDAKTAVLFTIASIVAGGAFAAGSTFVYALFRPDKTDPRPSSASSDPKQSKNAQASPA
ncbi:uncharacterized protein AB675_11377 [Cyphellophora attinorum]|uniref:Transmembrane protein n=1 Tax=Cyphellophora attinorum TaxID=1664694 RepID=A0A0N0NM49_9EURO|nr:uncharacterized protein AB675_11377 [Phialophora attinorum]KPI39938.1 hypothetical protein AB675_11377 [Phialophora attinorum]